MSQFHRVLKGLGMVTEHMVRRNGPKIQHRLERLTKHAVEIIKLAQEVATSEATATSNSKSAGGTPVNNFESTSPASHDPIGFDSLSPEDLDATTVLNSSQSKNMRENPVPSSQLGRLVGFGTLAVKLAVGEALGRATHVLSGQNGKHVLSEQSADQLAEALCRMRGAALKLGQMLSLQEDGLPPSLARALERVKQAADYMPKKQLEHQLKVQLGDNWRSKFLEFDVVPIAAASVGQVHKAKLLDGTAVAVKIQYPGVAESIESDLQNLKALVNMTSLLPPGLFLDNIIKVASSELALECKVLFVVRYRFFKFFAQVIIITKRPVR
jgi:aarF domain-containing kinase